MGDPVYDIAPWHEWPVEPSATQKRTVTPTCETIQPENAPVLIMVVESDENVFFAAASDDDLAGLFELANDVHDLLLAVLDVFQAHGAHEFHIFA